MDHIIVDIIGFQGNYVGNLSRKRPINACQNEVQLEQFSKAMP